MSVFLFTTTENPIENNKEHHLMIFTIWAISIAGAEELARESRAGSAILDQAALAIRVLKYQP